MTIKNTLQRGQRIHNVELDTITHTRLVKPNRLNMMIDLLNEVMEGEWHPTSQEQRPAGLKKDALPRFDLLNWQSDCKAAAGCGFSACAIGHACLDARFNELGLTSPVWAATPIYQGTQSWHAVEEFFGISDDDAYFLFSLDTYQPTQVPGTDIDIDAAFAVKPGPNIVGHRIELYLRRLKEDSERG